MDTLPDCRNCGACCWSPVEVDFIADWCEEDEAPKRRRLFIVDGRTPAKWRAQPGIGIEGAEACVCIYLRGTLTKRVSCRIYEDRPMVCRAFARGSSACREAIRQLETSFADLADERG